MNQRFATPLLLALLLTLGCASGGGGGFNLISLEEEWQLGAQLAGEIQRQMRVTRDPYISDLGRRIHAQTPQANLPYNFYLVEDPNVNAFSVPGGHVYIHTGLVAAATNASELAGVMAHEISHVVARHGTEQVSKQYGISILAAVVLGQNPSVLQQLVAQIVAGGAMARFSRADEEEADRLGVAYMAAAGFDPRGMSSMFRVLLSERQRRPSAIDKFFLSHPLTEDRIRDVENQVSRMQLRAGLATDEQGFQDLKRRVR